MLNLQQIEVRARALKNWAERLQKRITYAETKGGTRTEMEALAPEFSRHLHFERVTGFEPV
jgi:hypothetical protein